VAWSGFSLVDGGPLVRLMRRIGWTRPDGHIDHLHACLILVAVAWVPLLATTAAARLMAGRWFAVDWSVQARILIAIPLLLRADVSLHARTRSVADRFVSDPWAAGQTDRFDWIVGRAIQHRDAVMPEVVLLGLAVVASQFVVWNFGGMPFMAGRVALDRQMIAARWWYALVALPMFQFLVYRALWRWAIWTQMLWRLSRLRLQPIAIHPDLAGGLEFLSWPSLGFCYVIAALSAAQAGVWADQVLHAGVKVTDLKTPAFVFIAAAVVVALGPLVCLTGQLWRCKFEGREQYGRLAVDYSRLFHARWIENHDREGLLGAADIQSLADLANGYNVVDKTRFVPFGPRVMIAIAAAALAPMLPVALMGIPLSELLLKLGGTMLGKPG